MPPMRLVCFIFIYIIVTQASAQTNISGLLTVSDGKSPSAVSVLLHSHRQDGKIISYCFSDEQGRFKLSFNSEEDTINITTRSLSYRDTTLVLLNTSQELKIMLSPQVNKIKEVNVRGVPITAKDDTTTYMVSSFEKDSDESIGDVIDRMPGFTVDSKGKISYMGRPIDKYYIEGMDLLEGRYSIANKNLNNKAVGAVEVLHNHQPIKMLREQRFHDGTSVNIKLKKKYTTTFRATTTVGLPAIRHSINITPMLFSPKNQMIASIQSNNTGDDLFTQHRPFILSYSEIDNISNQKTELLSIPSLAPTFVNNRQRYLINHSNLVAFNYLTKLSDDEELKTNISYYNDWIKEDAQLTTEFYLEDDTVRLNELTENRFGKNSLITDLIYNQNASKQYINNKFRFENYWDKAQMTINNNAQQQKAYTPHFSIADELDWHRMIGKHFVSFKAFADYNHSPQKMRYTPGVFNDYINNNTPYNEAIQRFKQNELRSKFSAAFTLNSKKWAFSTKIGGAYDYNDLRTSIENEGTTVNADSLRNQLQWSNAEVSVDERISYESSKLKLRFNIPLSMVYYDIEDYYHSANRQFHQPLFSPRAYVNYRFMNYWTSTASLSYRQSLGEVDKLTQGYILRSYRSLAKGSNHLPEKGYFNLITMVEYKNPISGWFATLNYNHSVRQNDLTLRQVSLGNGIFQTEAIMLDNESKTNNIKGELTYFIAPWQSSISLNTNYTTNQSQYILDYALSNRQNNMTDIRLNFNLGYWRKFQFKYAFNFNMLEQETLQATTQFFEREHTADFFFYPNKKQWVNIRCEYNNALNAGESIDTFFGDITYAYKPTKGKLSYKLHFRNIFDSKIITQYSNSEIALIKNTYHLRPREVLLNIAYRF